MLEDPSWHIAQPDEAVLDEAIFCQLQNTEPPSRSDFRYLTEKVTHDLSRISPRNATIDRGLSAWLARCTDGSKQYMINVSISYVCK